MAEIALTASDVEEIKFRLGQALDNLNVAGKNIAPAAVVKVVEEFVDKWQDARRSSTGAQLDGPSVDDVAFGLGAAWGEQFLRQFGWTWIGMREGAKSYFAVAAPDRSLMVYPIDFLRACLTDPGIDCTAILAFNMLLGKKVPPLPAKRYEDLMRGVRRIVPKR